ncbi:type II toxin-antitoxin system VapC family toxin [Candidatus Woesearchaeota archaeon]|nr:type II toxin-antitoxin system VapC family toxin [Candidatus Woesearchaeota archaeon]
MARRYYIDTAIWRDLHENRKDKSKNLCELAFGLLVKIRSNKEKIVYSDFVVEELSRAYDEQTIGRLFKNVSALLEKIEISEEQIKEAAVISKELNIPFGDALHGVLARDNNAIMVTRDRHFKKFRDKIVVKKPEELI